MTARHATWNAGHRPVVIAADESGRSITLVGLDPEALLSQARAEAAVLDLDLSRGGSVGTDSDDR